MEGVAGPQGSLRRRDAQGPVAAPAGSGRVSPDSACSDGSAGSLENPPDAGQSCTVGLRWDAAAEAAPSFPLRPWVSDADSLSSAGGACPEEDEDADALRAHFDTLASGPSDGTLPRGP